MNDNFSGKVYLIGAGPGDAGLLTIKARDVLTRADVVVYDRLADDSILNYAPSSAEMIYVGKSAGRHTMKQDDINALLVKLARSYKNVVRLKGGDPFVFGRGGEEALTLEENGITFEIVPGVTSAIAAASYAGIPVTHRGVATSFAVVTGHEMNDDRSNIRWDKLATGVDTLIFLMGVANLQRITDALIRNGRAADTSAALIQWGTKSTQRVVVTTIEKAAADAQRERITAPAIFVVGEVVKLRDRLKWFETRPLFGKKILVTRARAQASNLTARLTELGAACVEVPSIKIVDPPDNYAAIDHAIDQLASYDHVIFTSVNGVDRFFDRLYNKKRDARAFDRSKIAAIGAATAAALKSRGIIADYVPTEYRAEALIDLISDVVADKKILIARAAEARSILPNELRRLGATVDIAAAYQTIADIDESTRIKVSAMIADGEIDLVTFTSSSTVKNFIAAFGVDALNSIKTAAIGPITADTLRSFGVAADIVALEYTIDGLIAAIIAAQTKEDGF